MKTLVTGGCGFIGSNLVKNLNPIDDITILDNLSTGNHINRKSNVKLDCSELNDFLDVCQFDSVYHLAADVDTQASDLKKILKVNAHSIKDILFSTKKFGSVVLASSASLYGNLPHESELGYLETQELDPLNYYAFSKRQMELFAQSNMDNNITVVSARFFNVYGPNDENKRTGVSILTSFCQQALAGKVEVFKGTLEHRRDFVHVDDVVKCMICLAGSANEGYDTFNIGSGQNPSIEELLSEISQHVTFKVKEIAPKVNFEALQTNTLANNTKVLNYVRKTIPNFEFKSWKLGVKETIERLQKNLAKS